MEIGMNGRIVDSGINNFVFVGEAGSGKSEIAINFALKLMRNTRKQIHFFDMDMTKPLFRSRDKVEELENQGIQFHYQEQFMDAPTMVGGVNYLMKDSDSYVILDVGGDYIGARAIGGFVKSLNRENTIVYYVLNVFRPWSHDIEHIDGTLGQILRASHIQEERIRLINNPNFGPDTRAEEFVEGCRRMSEIVNPYMDIDLACVREDLYEAVKEKVSVPVMPMRLYLTYPWEAT